MTTVLDPQGLGVPPALTELITLGRTLQRRAGDALAYFDRPGTSNAPTEDINGRLEHLRGTALSFLNLTNYILRSLLDTGGFRPRLHPHLRRAVKREGISDYFYFGGLSVMNPDSAKPDNDFAISSSRS
jgi:hypothetical protein